MLEDTLLIWRFKRGNNEALERIYEKYKNDLLKLAIMLVNEANTAEDIVHDTFLALAKSSDKIRTKGSLRSFLMTSVANRARNYRRDQQRRKTNDINKADFVVSGPRRPEQWAVWNEQVHLLSSAMRELPPEQREVIAIHHQGGLTFRQIAKMLDLSINTVQGRYRYGLEKLRTILNGEMEK